MPVGVHDKWQADSLAITKRCGRAIKMSWEATGGLFDEQSYSGGFFIFPCPNPHYDKGNKAASKMACFKSIRYSAGFHHNTGSISAFGNEITDKMPLAWVSDFALYQNS